MHKFRNGKEFSRSFFLLVVLMLSLGSNVSAQINLLNKPMPTSASPQAENSIAINPANPLNILVCCMNVSASNAIDRYYTTDGGNNWSGTDGNPNGATPSADPVALFDTYGNGYCVYMGSGDNHIYIQKTTDGGSTWGSQVETSTWNFEGAQSLDKPHAMAMYQEHIRIIFMWHGWASDMLFMVIIYTLVSRIIQANHSQRCLLASTNTFQ